MYLMHLNVVIHNFLTTKTTYTINAHNNLTFTSPQITGKHNQKPIVGIPSFQQVLDEEINDNSLFLFGIRIRIKRTISGVSLNLPTKHD
jgi:hypothetical protein